MDFLKEKGYIDIKWLFDKQKVIYFTKNNFYKTDNYGNALNYTLHNIIHAKGAAIWMNAKGELCYRFSPNSKIHISSMRKASMALSNFLGKEIIICHKKPPLIDINKTLMDSKNYIYINELLLVEDEQFRPDIRQEFFAEEGLIYRNTFSPTQYPYDNIPYQANFKKSIIGKYIYYLANHNEDRFHYIMNWLARFFQDFSNKFPKTLVLIGKPNSGIEILFEEIIEPLFGSKYCIRLNEDNIKTNNIYDLVTNKLFYNIDQISSTSLDKNNVKKLLTDLIHNKNETIEIYNKKNIIETKIFGQTLVTSTNSHLPYINPKSDSYTVFNVEGDIELNFRCKRITFPKTANKPKLINKIRNNLLNFSRILTIYANDYNIDIEDDKLSITGNNKDILKLFADAIVTRDIGYFEDILNKNSKLHNELMEDFDKDRIKQSNIMKCFISLYGDKKIKSSRTLMVALRKINNDFFNIENIHSGTGGIKYFIYS